VVDVERVSARSMSHDQAICWERDNIVFLTRFLDVPRFLEDVANSILEDTH
jgi:hypothetical protein